MAKDVEEAEETGEAEEADELEEAAEAISKAEGRGSLLLWFAVLGSPLAWAGHLGLNYSLEEWYGCAPTNEDKGEILGIGVHALSALLNTAMLAIAVASALVAYTCWKKLRGQADQGVQATQAGDETPDRARWMAFAGVVEGCLFVGIILLGYLPLLFLGTCETIP